MKRNHKSSLIFLIILLLEILACLIVAAMTMEAPQPQDRETTAPMETPEASTQTEAPPTTEETEPPIVKQSTATIGATGDILMHDMVIQSGKQSDGTYDYHHIFEYLDDYTSALDFAVANLEVTLGGTENGREYAGYPNFNCPDAIVEALKDAGFDMLLTANNHAYDTGNTGFHRTQQVVSDAGLLHIGTRPGTEDKTYTVQDINGIRVGMVCYTYNTSQDADGTVSLNGIPLSNANSQLINSFSYYRLDTFYEKLGSEVEAMTAEGAEALVIFIHWGDEYHTTQNSTQETIAQELCNMGFDVIVGNHAHVPQPVELLTSETDEGQKTLCLYSTGNTVSNIYRSNTRPPETEDGMVFSFTFAKYSDGTVVLEGAEILPIWNPRYYYLYKDTDLSVNYRLIPLDPQSDWQAAFRLNDTLLDYCNESNRRTQSIVAEGLAEANAWYSAHQAEIEAQLGIQ